MTDRKKIFEDVRLKHERRTDAVRRTIGHAPDVLSARDRLRIGVSELPGVSGDPDTVSDIMLFVDQFVQRKKQLDTAARHV